MELNVGDFIYHDHYGVGRIQETQSSSGDAALSRQGLFEVRIKFQDGETRPFTSELLERAAHKISPNGFRVNAYLNASGATELLIADQVEAVAMVLQDFPGLLARTDEIKDYLSRYLKEVDEWWDIAQPKLKQSPRIDTTQSRYQMYGLRHEDLSPAEEIYLSFNRIRPFEDRPIVYEQARRTLAEYLKGSELGEEHLGDVVGYVQQIVAVDSNDPAIRIDAIFRLQEGKWLKSDQALEYLDVLARTDFRLYQLDIYSLNRMVEFLTHNPLSLERKSLLATAICADETTIAKLSDWALNHGDTEFIAQLVLTALSENRPPELEKEKLEWFVARLKQVEKLIRAIDVENAAWPTITAAHEEMVMILADLDLTSLSPLFDHLLGLSNALFERLHNRYPDNGDQIVQALLCRDRPVQFVMGLLDSARSTKALSAFGSKLEEQLWHEGEGRNYDFLKDITDAKESTLEKVTSLVEYAQRYDSSVLRSRAGELVCELIKKDSVTNRVLFLPALNRMHEWRGKWAWSTTLRGLREEIYLNALAGRSHNLEDEALRSAVDRYVGEMLSRETADVDRLGKELQIIKLRATELESSLAEKEQVVRELKSGFGGDTAAARFEEKVRIARELVTSMAEFERMALKLPTALPELDAIIRRLNSFVSGLGVSLMEPIGTQVQFNPQKHRMVDSTGIESGSTVTIVERGYLIRDNKDKLRLLKPSLVIK